MFDLTKDQRQELGKPGPIQARDPDTGEVYVLLRAEDYERMRAVLDGFTKRAGWDDPRLDDYEAYRKQA
jgi:hypothetical protein